MMLTSSAKAKGRNLQKLVVERILLLFPELKDNDVISTSMGKSGEDVSLSPHARNYLPVSFECKNKKAFAVYKDYEQAQANAKGWSPVLVIKQNSSMPLAIMDLDYYLLLERFSEKTEATFTPKPYSKSSKKPKDKGKTRQKEKLTTS